MHLVLEIWGNTPLFFRLTVPSSRFRSPLLEAEDMLLGPVGFRDGTPKAPDKDRATDLGEPPLPDP